MRTWSAIIIGLGAGFLLGLIEVLSFIVDYIPLVAGFLIVLSVLRGGRMLDEPLGGLLIGITIGILLESLTTRFIKIAL
ncbi:MAG: hypothetical protein JSV20_02660 [Candidatus Bathyarchaeota archaeon]|nr:MAG: hypothetical protein JSV20_02660 [Candidatus Bathyarchaeota archaeon]